MASGEKKFMNPYVFTTSLLTIHHTEKKTSYGKVVKIIVILD